MAISANDVGVLTVETPDQDFRAGQNIDVTVEAEAGVALHATGGQFRVRMTMTDRTNPTLLNQQDIVGNYGGAAWPNPGLNTFTLHGAGRRDRRPRRRHPRAAGARHQQRRRPVRRLPRSRRDHPPHAVALPRARTGPPREGGPDLRCSGDTTCSLPTTPA